MTRSKPRRLASYPMEAPPRLGLGVKALQASALPLGYGAIPIIKMVGAIGLEPMTLCL